MAAFVFFMYHQIGDADAGELRYGVTIPDFRAQLDHLKYAGYEVLSVGQALARRHEGRPRVVLTFDDGHATDRTVAAPLLMEYGFGATFYVVPGLLGHSGFMTRAQLVGLERMGFEIGSHSMSHRYLTDLDAASLRQEIEGSKQRLEDVLGREVCHFACPGGRVNRAVVRTVKAAGYRSLATSHAAAYREGSDPYDVARVPLHRQTSLGGFRQLCRGDGFLARQLSERLLAAAKAVLGNRAYERVRGILLASQA